MLLQIDDVIENVFEKGVSENVEGRASELAALCSNISVLGSTLVNLNAVGVWHAA